LRRANGVVCRIKASDLSLQIGTCRPLTLDPLLIHCGEPSFQTRAVHNSCFGVGLSGCVRKWAHRAASLKYRNRIELTPSALLQPRRPARGRPVAVSRGPVHAGHRRTGMACMDGEICWQVELLIKPDQLESFRALTGEMIESTRRELGVLSYRRFISTDGTTVYIFERYADSAAALTHLQTFAKEFAERFLKLVERKSFVVFGDPTAELKAALDGYSATYAKPFGDFAYWE